MSGCSNVTGGPAIGHLPGGGDHQRAARGDDQSIEWAEEYLLELVSVADVPAEVRRLTGERTKPHKSTIFRWIHHGLAGRYLPAVKFGGRTHVMRGRLIEFLYGQGVGGAGTRSADAADAAEDQRADAGGQEMVQQLRADILRLQAAGNCSGRLPKWFQRRRQQRANLGVRMGILPDGFEAGGKQ